MGRVFLYAGQGSQRAGMGADIYNEFEAYRAFVDQVDKEIKVKNLMHEGPEEELLKTQNTQPCMGTFAAGVTMVLREAGIEPMAACGLSLGEYGALYAAGVFEAMDYIKLLAYRGKVMAEAAAGLSCSMSAILGIGVSRVIEDEVALGSGKGYVTVSNYNCPGQTVICGDEDAVSDMEERLKKKGAKRCVRLKVSGPFHTKYMEGAGDRLAAYFDEITFSKPSIPVASNFTGNIIGEDDDIKLLLREQVQKSVRLEDDLKALINAGCNDFIEIGPGNTMSGFLKKTARAVKADVRVAVVDTAEDIKKLIG